MPEPLNRKVRTVPELMAFRLCDSAQSLARELQIPPTQFAYEATLCAFASLMAGGAADIQVARDEVVRMLDDAIEEMRKAGLEEFIAKDRRNS